MNNQETSLVCPKWPAFNNGSDNKRQFLSKELPKNRGRIIRRWRNSAERLIILIKHSQIISMEITKKKQIMPPKPHQRYLWKMDSLRMAKIDWLYCIYPLIIYIYPIHKFIRSLQVQNNLSTNKTLSHPLSLLPFHHPNHQILIFFHWTVDAVN